MKTIIDDWDFDASSGTFTFTELDHQLVLHRLLMITHQPTNTIIYNLADPSTGSATVVGYNQIDLEFDTSVFADSDEFTIIYDAPEVLPSNGPSAPVVSDNLIAGNTPLTTADGVQVVSLAGSMGVPIDTTYDGLNVFTTNPTFDLIKPPLPNGQPDSLARSNMMGVVTGGAWTIPYTVSVGQTLVIDAANFRGISISVPTTQGQITWGQSNYPDRNFTSFGMQHATGAVSTSNGGGGTTTGFWIGNLSCRYLSLTSASLASSGIIQLTAWPNSFIPPSQFATSTVANNADNNGSSSGGLIVVSQPWVQRGWTPATVATEQTGTFMDRQRAVIDKMESTGVGITATGVMGQYDEVAPSPVQATENRFYVARMNKGRSLHQVVRDGSAGANEIGATVTSRGALQVEDITQGYMASGAPMLEVVPGVQGFALVDEFGDTIDTVNHGLATVDVTPAPALVPFLGANKARLSARRLMSVMATNANASVRYLQIFDMPRDVIAGDPPELSFPIPAGTAAQPSTVELGLIFFGAKGFATTNPLTIAVSTTATTYTAATPSDHQMNGLTL